ncbi:TauD/TfdA family dioxygenase [Paraburkholderia bonniea]|uniref:TauD/TfdA family dioxygenase n=1 Tax=Paraburkholderia bonniea TaxID=2152891 RepID=UPI0012914327|nr:TauD/TfdA family dioxygenase [Paraburkholderia bonniea]WJF91492.1 TauD/TfdA family dioxygenase [Paraburkholderia bonniea]WJF94810.1 TauD/TfdA family dioxygenase [Paraburkholderia bonniea]
MQLAEPMIEDWRAFTTHVSLDDAVIAQDAVTLTWSDRRVSLFHFAWLRDNCACSQCVHPLTREQVFEIADMPDDLRIQAASIDHNGALNTQWTDGHRSVYGPGWLRAHAYDETSRAERRGGDQVQPWCSEYGAALTAFDWHEIRHDDTALLAWLVALRRTGLTLLRGVPSTPDTVAEVAQRISFIRESNFGVLFDVVSKPTPDSNAYTSINLPPHTDLPTRELQPGLQFLHCLINEASGGDSIFIDGFALAAHLRQHEPEVFATLTSVPFEFWNKSATSDYRASAPVIALDGAGEVSEVRHANFLRGPVSARSELMPEIYHAYRRFIQLGRDPRFRVQRRLAAGEMWAFDNRRVLHARTEFDPQTGARHLQGCYIDRDELLSRIRVLERAVGAKAR